MDLVERLWNEVQKIASQVGPSFWALIVLGGVIAFVLLTLWRALRYPDPPVLSSGEWLRVLGKKGASPKIVERLENSLSQDAPGRASQLLAISQQLFASPARRFRFAFVIISSAPLLGLLGTVVGMYLTFQGIGMRGGERASVDTISKGIAEALITTQTGLVIGIPTLILCSWMKSRHDQQRLAFNKLESRLMQQQPALS